MDAILTPDRPLSPPPASPDTAWRDRALTTLFGFAVALLFGALVCFVAWNWAYFSTEVRLGGLALMLVAAAVLWLWRGVETRWGVVFGMTAQLLIGVWLAAAAQIYQAPGELADLTFRWSWLGLPFALASRSWAHWALWLAVATVTLTGSPAALEPFLGDRRDAFGLLAVVVLFLGASAAARVWRGPDWFATAAAVVAGFCALNFTLVNMVVFDLSSDAKLLQQDLPTALAAGLCASGLGLSLRDGRRAAASVFASFTALIVGFLLGFMVEDLISNDILAALVYLLLAGGLTYALVRCFALITRQTKPVRAVAVAAPSVTTEDDGAAWYTDAVIGLGGILTATAAVSLLFLLLELTGLGDTALLRIMGAIGFAAWIIGLVLRRRGPGTFLRFVFNTLIMLGLIGTVAGFGLEWDIFWPASLFALVLIGVTAVAVPHDRILHVVLALGVILAVLSFLMDFKLNEDVIAMVSFGVFSVAGVLLATEVIGTHRRLLPATVFLLAALVSAVVFDVMTLSPEYALAPRLLDIGVLLIGLAWVRYRLGERAMPSLLVTAVLVSIAIILPLGAGAALLILLLGYGLRSLAMFGLGVAAAAWFLGAAYYDLSFTLLELAVAFAVSGLLLLGLWWAAQRQAEVAA